MRSFYSFSLSLLLAGSLSASLTATELKAQAAKEFAIEVDAEVRSATTIAVTWKAVPDASVYIVRRRLYGELTWGKENFVDATATEFVDDKVEAGKVYEYRVGVPGGKSIYGFVASGVAVQARASEGTLLLIVGETAATTAAAGLEQYIDDLVRVGWNVEMRTVSETATPQEVKARILEVRSGLGDELRSVFLFGRVPIPYSGNLAPDGHVEDHLGAWPADGYYGDLDGSWTDVSVTSTSAIRDENKNAPGDGKFDQNSFPSAIELAVGRVDFRRMGWFYPDASSPEEREALLLNNYLEKNHKFRLAQLPHNSKAVVSDVIGELGQTDIPAAIAWRTLPPLTNDVQATTDWMNLLSSEAHLWAYGAGFGNYFVAQGIGTTEEYSKRDPKAIFTMLFGSRFGDWNSDDNLLRAPLGTSAGLASMWAGRPYWYLHQMAMGMTIGEATRQSQSASASYIPTYAEGNVEMALMGDPTLHNIEIPVQLTGLRLEGSNTLKWDNAGENARYAIARASSPHGPFDPLTETTIAETSYNVGTPDPSWTYYLVRPVLNGRALSTGDYYQSGRGQIINVVNSVRSEDAVSKHLSLQGNAICVNDVAGNATLTIIDVLGRTVAQRAMTVGETCDVSSLNAGAYIAQLRSAEGVEVLRFNR